MRTEGEKQKRRVRGWEGERGKGEERVGWKGRERGGRIRRCERDELGEEEMAKS